MQSGRVILESMSSASLGAARRAGLNIHAAAPKEGYRAWNGGMYLSVATQGRQRDIAYEYMDWWLSGWPGANMIRSGFYTPTPERCRAWMSDAEWGYWYEGKVALEDIRAPDGEIVALAGEERNGGSYQDRMSRIAVWNTETTNFDYLSRRWYEFVLL